MNWAELGQILSVWAVPIVLAVTLHEAAHGWMAEKRGDDTARRLGRVSFNPIRHVDPVGTVVLPGVLVLVGAPFLFGWAKPVPVAFHRLYNPKRDMIWVALAGPGINILMALASGFVLHLFDRPDISMVELWIVQNLHNFIAINVMLAVFNMLPLPPLDGGRVVTGLLPGRLAVRFAELERYGIVLLLLLITVVPMVGRELGFEQDPLTSVLRPAVGIVYAAVRTLTGWG